MARTDPTIDLTDADKRDVCTTVLPRPGSTQSH